MRCIRRLSGFTKRTRLRRTTSGGSRTLLQKEPASRADLPCLTFYKTKSSVAASYKTNSAVRTFRPTAVLQNEPACGEQRPGQPDRSTKRITAFSQNEIIRAAFLQKRTRFDAEPESPVHPVLAPGLPHNNVSFHSTYTRDANNPVWKLLILIGEIG